MKLLILIFFAGVLGLTSLATHGNNTEVNVSGFARLVAGVLDEDNVTFQGYDNSVSFSEQSLGALQLDAKFNGNWSFTGQLLAHSNKQRKSGVEWLYVSYKPNKSWQIDLGRMRAPVYQYSNVVDVGYAYPWITAPYQVYGNLILDTVDGIKASYTLSTSAFSADLEAYYGKYENTVGAVDSFRDANSDNFRGIALTVSVLDLQVRASMHSGNINLRDSQIEQFEAIVRKTGYQRTADSLLTDGDATAVQLSMSYDKLDYFVKAEWIKIDSPMLIYPKINGSYISYGRMYFPFTVHLTYATSHYQFDQPVDEIPAGLSPQLDALVFGYQSFYNNLPKDNLESLALGIRWDFHQGWALKGEYSHLWGDKNTRAFFGFDDINFDRKGNLYQVAVEWVF